LVPDGDGFWIAGDAAVGWSRLNGVPVRALVVGVDLPAAPLDLAVDAEYLWVATSAGLVRFRLAEVRP
jgi:ligand-binding sensor domain-containing protein